MPRAVHLAILRNAALLVPASTRAEWLAEWQAELWYVEHDATAFCMGSFRDALWLRIKSIEARSILNLDSPLRCLLFLVGLAALTFWLAIASGNPSWSLAGAEDFAQSLVGMFAIFLPFLLIPNRPALGSYPKNEYAPSLPIRLRRWLFFVVKISLASSVSLAAMTLLTAFPPISFLFYVGMAFGCRWILDDQRQRCPVCLHLLSNPVAIGNAARAIFQPYGTELVCTRGHGLLYVPGAPTTWSAAQRWRYLDSSWGSLLSKTAEKT